MFIPYSTDAPIYHWPFATVGMMVLNTVVFVATFSLNPEIWESNIDPWMLDYGQGLRPWQWVTSNFIHAGIPHLLGNMIWLWIFGLVVEGKLGWWKYLLVYFGIGILECAVEQTITLGFESGGSVGASSIIFGLMAMTLVWAPKNDVNCISILFIFYFIRTFNFTVSFLTLVAIAIVYEVATGIILPLVTGGQTGLVITSGILHLLGAATGLGLAVYMLRKGWVDCENWDIFSVFQGKHEMTSEQLDEIKEQSAEHQQQVHLHREAMLKQVRELLQTGQATLAYKAHQHAMRTWDGWQLPEPELIGLVDAFHQQKMWADSIPLMRQYLTQYKQRSAQVRMRLAAILIQHLERPTQALQVLSKIDVRSLKHEAQVMWNKLRAQAQAGADKNPYEVTEGEW